ncbi:hypothetical protein BS17DRAFT_778995 [Gyrodon lividus]|nr:hypothetical protein BS17DRAFT_778995 [Gyrodon lividus]
MGGADDRPNIQTSHKTTPSSVLQLILGTMSAPLNDVLVVGLGAIGSICSLFRPLWGAFLASRHHQDRVTLGMYRHGDHLATSNTAEESVILDDFGAMLKAGGIELHLLLNTRELASHSDVPSATQRRGGPLVHTLHSTCDRKLRARGNVAGSAINHRATSRSCDGLPR